MTIATAALKEIEGALRIHGRLEIGGMLFGEMAGPNQFLIHEATVADDVSGTWLSFVRYPGRSLRRLRRFFKKHQFNYRKFNYLGEWHSHPSFSLEPSRRDLGSMSEILRETEGIQFALLVVARLVSSKVRLQGFVLHQHLPSAVKVTIGVEN